MSGMFSLEGRVALVTGASRGLGWAMAKALAAAGAHTVLNGRDAKTLQSRADELMAEGLSSSIAPFDVTDEALSKTAIKSIVNEFSQLDILLNNAGIVQRLELRDIPTTEWQKILDINLTACFVLAREAAGPMMAQGWGRIINTASVLTFISRPTGLSYAVSKHGLAGLTKAVAVDLGSSGVTCNAIAPGFIATEINADARRNKEFSDKIKNRTPLGRWGEPEELEGAVVFLASNASSYARSTIY